MNNNKIIVNGISLEAEPVFLYQIVANLVKRDGDVKGNNEKGNQETGDAGSEKDGVLKRDSRGRIIWSPDLVAKIKEMIKNKVKIKKIAKQFGVPAFTIYNLKNFGKNKKTKRVIKKFTPEEIEFIKNNASNMTHKELGAHLGRKIQSYNIYLKKFGIKCKSAAVAKMEKAEKALKQNDESPIFTKKSIFE